MEFHYLMHCCSYASSRNLIDTYLIKAGNSFLYYHESALVKSTSGNLCLISADTMFYFGTGLGIVYFYYKKWKFLRLNVVFILVPTFGHILFEDD